MSRSVRCPAPGTPLQESLQDPNSKLQRPEFDACGVGFVGSKSAGSHAVVAAALAGLAAVEHRGACAADGRTTDGIGVMISIPRRLLGIPQGAAVGQFFLPVESTLRTAALDTIWAAFNGRKLEIFGVRDVPVDAEAIGPIGRATMPFIAQIFVRCPEGAAPAEFDSTLYETWRDLEELGARGEFRGYCCSLSRTRVVYKALCTAPDLRRFYPDLTDPRCEASFALFHRRFCTNTTTAWSRAQPFMFIAHNGEINTIAGNRRAMAAREQYYGERPGRLLTAAGLSDSGSLDQTVAALRYSSALAELRALTGGTLASVIRALIPPIGEGDRRLEAALEPWDGPALIAFSDGAALGARLDRNGFRPFHVVETDEMLLGCSEAGAFDVAPEQVRRKLRLGAGESIWMEAGKSTVHFEALHSPERRASVHDLVVPQPAQCPAASDGEPIEFAVRAAWHALTAEESSEILTPMILTAKEGIGSMGDTARLAAVSEEPRAFCDYLHQSFAQVTNPPIDFLRERAVTDLRMFIPRGDGEHIELRSPILAPAQLAWLRSALTPARRIEIDARVDAEGSLPAWCERASAAAARAVEDGATVLVLSDLEPLAGGFPVPPPLAVGAIERALMHAGLLGRAVLIVESGEIKSAHEAAMTIACGASAVCPAFAFAAARKLAAEKDIPAAKAEENLLQALTDGFLKVMSKVGISIARSYRGSRLYTVLGLGAEVTALLGCPAGPIGGLSLSALEHKLRRRESERAKLPHLRLFREALRGEQGERHEMTQMGARRLHEILRELRGPSPDITKAATLYREYIDVIEADEPVALRHFLELAPLAERGGDSPDTAAILRTFGSGAVSFGAIGKLPQRDIFRAMALIGGRSNSGEGGENPLYFTDGTTAGTKQIASGHFGVSADYLNRGTREIQIKIGQGAKPGEGGQLMGTKVSAEIAKARHARPGQDLISPPPLHDIYSIEDLTQKIFELRAVNPGAVISVKLVSGADVGTIAVGVAKCGADVIHIAGHDGGTGAAGMLSMKHTGLPWEIGLSEAHRALTEEGLRSRVRLRVDGGLRSGRDIVIASILGADEFDFGKLLLVGQGCLFLRVCHTNKCSPGIATQDPRLEARYAAEPHDRAADIANLLRLIAAGAAQVLQEIGAPSLAAVRGHSELLSPRPGWRARLEERAITFAEILRAVSTPLYDGGATRRPLHPEYDLVGETNIDAVAGGARIEIDAGTITPEYRALGAWSAGALARRAHDAHRAVLSGGAEAPAPGTLRISAAGSAGQAFGVFCRAGMRLELCGEANDSVGKSMSGGEIVILPPRASTLPAEDTSIIGNVALYGATGGRMYVYGRAGDRFAVRNSGATAVVEALGMHGCEYMTSGDVVVLGECGLNLGSGMTGGRLFVTAEAAARITNRALRIEKCRDDERSWLIGELSKYHAETGSSSAFRALSALKNGRDPLLCVRHEALIAAAGPSDAAPRPAAAQGA